MGSKSDAFENLALDHALRNTAYTPAATVYSALYTVIPSDSSNGTEVVTTAGYTRVATSFCTAGLTATGQSANTNTVTFGTAVSAYTVVGWGILDASTVSGAGVLLYWATVTTLAIGIGDQATFAAAGITITED